MAERVFAILSLVFVAIGLLAGIASANRDDMDTTMKGISYFLGQNSQHRFLDGIADAQEANLLNSSYSFSVYVPKRHSSLLLSNNNLESE